MSEPSNCDTEGFICPYCLVGFASTSSLSKHFLTFHNDGIDGQPLINIEEESRSLPLSTTGHAFKSCLIPKPIPCHLCRDVAWNNGLMCQGCNKVIHERCAKSITDKCEGRVPQIENVVTSSLPVSSVPQGNPRAEVAGSRKGTPTVKHLVTRGRERYIDEEFDLDLTYITERIIAMSFPASGLETTYRNSLKDVAKMLHSKHQNNYMVFNVSERSYDTSKFNNQVLDFGWPDHHAPPLARLSSVCKSIKSWLDSAPQHVAVVHCKGGKGRTGCVIAAFIHYTKLCKTAQEALNHFAMKRFTGNKRGVTQPSQRRYVMYFGELLKGNMTVLGPTLLLRHIIIHGVPDFDGRGGCRPFVKVYQNLELHTTSGLFVCGGDNSRVKLSFYNDTVVQGEVLLKCFHKKQSGGHEIMFRVQFHTSAVDEHQLVFAKEELDEAYKDKRFADNAKVEVIFSSFVESETSRKNVKKHSDIRHSLLGGHEKPPITTETLSRSDSYEDFRKIEDFGVSSIEEDLIQLDSPLGSPTNTPRSLDRSDEAFYSSIDPTTKSIVTAEHKRRPLPPTPSEEEEQDMAGKHVAEARRLWESQGGPLPPPPAQGMGGPPDQPPERYNYVDPEKLIALESTSEQGWYKVVHREGEEQGGGGVGDYFNIDEEGDGPNIVTQVTSSKSPGGGANRVSIIELNRPPLATATTTAAATTNGTGNPKDYANMYKHGPGPEEDYVNNPLDLLEAAQNTADVPGQEDYINSDVVDQLSGEDFPLPGTTPPSKASPTSDPIYCEPPDARDYINTDDLEFSASLEDCEGEDPSRSGGDKPTRLDNFVSAMRSKLNIKEKGPSQIQSKSIVENDHSKSLGFYKVSVPIQQVQQKKQMKGEDYFFVKDTWGTQEAPNVSQDDTSATYAEISTKKSPSQPRKTYPLPGAASSQKTAQSTKLIAPPVPPPNKPKSPITGHKVLSPSSNGKPLASGTSSLGKAPPPKPQPYRKDKPSGWGGVAETSPPDEGGVSEPTPPSSKPTPASKPHFSGSQKQKQALSRQSSAPVQPKSRSSASRKDVMSRKSFWYKPDFSRDAASDLMMKSGPGYFIVRDSSTVAGGYALTIRVSEDIVRAKMKLPPDIVVTNDMCVKHFLIQPDAKGVRLQGWSEPPFSNLEEFIHQHCLERYCLPIVLVLPTSDLDSSSQAPPPAHGSSKPAKARSPSQEQAATDLIYLGMVDVSGPGSESVIASVAEQFKSLQLTKANVVNFKASKDGLTVTDTVSGSFVKRFHSLPSITFCGLDPSDTRWEFDGLDFKGKSISVKKARCFGFVWKPNERSGHMCALFGELDSSQPVAAIVHFIKKLIQKYNT